MSPPLRCYAIQPPDQAAPALFVFVLEKRVHKLWLRTLIKLFSRIPWQKRAVRCELLFGGFEIPSGSPSRIPLLGYQTTTASACITHDPAMRTSRLARSAFKRTKFPVGNLSI
jgi:hypothetical protein